MNVIDLAKIDASMVDLVGGKAAGLGEMIRAGERVPDGFCLTTRAHRSGTLDEDELVEAYRGLVADTDGRVAVRSSATAEDLPEASFAGQQDTFLNVRGADGLVGAVRACWASLHTERAVAYREANNIDHDTVAMAVVVQRMVDPVVAGVVFTANPVTGNRTETIIDAAPGLGTAIVDGTVVPDHYVWTDPSRTVDSGERGCLGRAQLDELGSAGVRLRQHFGTPQDIEWAIDADGVLWLLQCRPITTLFPQPPRAEVGQTRLYFEFGHIQGMLRPFTPMGLAVLKVAAAGWMTAMGVRVDPLDGIRRIVPVGGRAYADITDLARSRWTRRRLPKGLDAYGPRVRGMVERLLDDPRFAPTFGLPFRASTALKMTLRLTPGGVIGITRSLARPHAARERALRALDRIGGAAVGPGEPASAADRLRYVIEDAQRPIMGRDMMALTWPLMTGVMLASAPAALLRGVAADGEVDITMGGMPHNVTTEMDLALWRLADNARQHRELLTTTPPERLTARYRAHALPDIGLDAFLAAYGRRAAGEIDVGLPRWAEDPTPLFATIANYLRLDDPAQSPEQRFARAAATAEAKIDELAARARSVRGRIAVAMIRRARALGGLREIGKFAWLAPLAQARHQLLLIGAELTENHLLDRAEDVMFLDLHELAAAVHHRVDHRGLLARRRADYQRELRRTQVPAGLLSDGTDLETLTPPPAAQDGVLVGMPAAAGQATGRARVIRDPAGARIEPGEILVAPTTDPGWTPLFMTAAGLVTETGSPAAHGPTVAREYGIPAVICVRDATHTITTGQTITIDGAAGTIHIGPD
ncbi:PEP/pyruvate-binding domain-containing protein [Pseudonocardia acaciae]|uniref:PEP/pyruvate-binding domain-containing protein n=1 Tax=Pseudonocardia acaciae TaxID=551276 RepID=UPI000491FC43|nr:PEP/pyruvate-binding domain-containing protein [Pseudonocardia acaciae]